jgi:hypothetical protein
VGVVFGPFHLDDDTILHVGVNPAMGKGVADITDGLSDFNAGLFSRHFHVRFP